MCAYTFARIKVLKNTFVYLEEFYKNLLNQEKEQLNKV